MSATGIASSPASTAPTHRAASVEFDHVTKSYDAKATKGGAPGAVNDLSLQVPAGKICVLVGPSGCGKTTSLKMVNRLIEPTSGRILLDGVDAATRDTTELRRGIGYVIQQTGLFPHQTIEENVVTVPRLLGWDKARMQARSEELLSVVGLDPAKYARRYPAQLSGGERQRVGVARALAADPPVMLMDEPFGAVDPIVRERLQNEFLRLQEQLAKTILFVTHDIDEAIKMGDLVVVFRGGGVVAQVGPPAEILANPASDYVARFVGTDRGLKRLSLFRVGELPLSAVVTAPVGSDGSIARRVATEGTFEHVLITDDAHRPVGWVHRDRLTSGTVTADLAESTSPLLDRRTTLKDALSMLLDADVQAGLVVDRTGALRGMVTVAEIAALMRDGGSVPMNATERAAADADEG
ncbi:MAG TPA: betaine/proline/choline family ABC transporter ATP-binding protein [Candidatus Limnocylindrales bacterium]|nr:betaine/proline/choline family ABC transporter ATP-binding protein [Candidatus Limnocylindrales bacterium]